MLTVLIPHQYHLIVDRLYTASLREHQPAISLMPMVGTASDGRATYLGMTEEFLDVLRRESIPFEEYSN
jgi:hypothetical protein